jgi:hypothetical protein
MRRQRLPGGGRQRSDNDGGCFEGRPGRSYAEELRSLLYRGKTRDKINCPDPAAAPLGTDDEATGTTPPPAQVRRAIEDEAGREPVDMGARGAGHGVIEGGPAYALLAAVSSGVLLMLLYAITHIR